MLNEEGLRIISDGTAEDTYLIIDGKLMDGLTSVTWKIDPANRQAEICFHLRDLTIGPDQLPEATLRTLDQLVKNLLHSMEVRDNKK